jgi:undecaprenyl-diphosphatase
VAARSVLPDGRPARALAVLAAVALLAVLALLVDGRIHAYAPVWKAAYLDAIVGVLNPIGAGVTLLLVCTAMSLGTGLARHSRLHRAASLAAVTFIVAGLIEFTLKHTVGRPRPDVNTDLDSFPSGHATSVFAVATVFAHFFPGLRMPLYTLASAIAVGRVYLDRHYVSDIAAGAMIGWLVATWLIRATDRYAGVLPEWAARSVRRSAAAPERSVELPAASDVTLTAPSPAWQSPGPSTPTS